MTGRAASAIVASAVVAGLVAISQANYLLFHTLVELFGVVIGVAIFILAWNTRRFADNQALLLLGVASLFIAGTALLHAVSYSGMGVFPDAGSNLPTQLWLVTRFLAAGSFLLAPLFVRRRLPLAPALTGFAVVTSSLVAAVFLGVFPDAWLPGTGLTAFKIYAELVIVAMLMSATGLLVAQRRRFDHDVWQSLIGSLVAAVLAEIAFTRYLGVYDLANMAGHIALLVSTYLLYRAIVVSALVRPYALLFRELAQARDDLERRVQTRTAELERAGEALRAQTRRLHELSQRLVEVQEEERRSIARELHDDAGQALTALKIGLALLKREAGGSAEVEQRIGSLAEQVEGVMESLHRMAANLRPPSLDRLGLAAAVRQHVERFSAQTGLPVDLAIAPAFAERIVPELETALYRVIQEALTNVARHARAGRAAVMIERNGDHVVAIVEDDGIGFDPEQVRARGRLGLFGMEERVAAVGGILEVESAAGEGSRIVARIPIAHGGQRAASG